MKLTKTRIGYIFPDRLRDRFAKHCGVCHDADFYFHAPVSKEVTLVWPKHGINESEIVAMCPEGRRPRPAIFKPENGEDEGINRSIGGHQSVREEAAFLIDRALGYYLVPVSYVTEVNGERGAAIHYVPVTKRKPVSAYSPEWIEKSAILDYIIGQIDRRNHNWMTSPILAIKPVLYDNGYALPVTGDHHIHSAFVDAQVGKPLTDTGNLERVLRDSVLWNDVRRLVGTSATELAQDRTNALLERAGIPAEGG